MKNKNVLGGGTAFFPVGQPHTQELRAVTLSRYLHTCCHPHERPQLGAHCRGRRATFTQNPTRDVAGGFVNITRTGARPASLSRVRQAHNGYLHCGQPCSSHGVCGTQVPVQGQVPNAGSSAKKAHPERMGLSAGQELAIGRGRGSVFCP